MSDESLMIKRFRVHRLSVPLPRRYISGMHDYVATENVLLELQADAGVGLGRAFTFQRGHADAIHALIVEMAESLLGRDVSNVRAEWARLARQNNFVGTGPAVMALGAVDTALWDLLAQRAGMPLYRLLGGVQDRLPVYASGGWYTYSDQELADEAVQLAEAGYAGYKIKIGRPDWRIDIGRVEGIVQAVGDRIDVMVDANQSWSVNTAIKAGRVLASLGVDWLEEPVPAADLDATARVAGELDIRIAAGETMFGVDDFLPMLERRAVDVVMPNLVRVGGPSQMVKLAALADAQHLPISSHTLTEVAVHVMAAIPNASLVEYIPGWWDLLFEGAPAVVDGHLQLSDGPGLGFTFAERALKEFAVEAAVERSV